MLDEERTGDRYERVNAEAISCVRGIYLVACMWMRGRGASTWDDGIVL